MLGFDLKQSRSYARFLACHASALRRLQRSVRLEDRSDIDEMIDRIGSDLDLLGVVGVAARCYREDLNGFGVAYVLRGSRMGARVLRSRIGPNLPTRYMEFTPVVPWRSFLSDLESHAAKGDEVRRHRIVASARHAFAAFSPGGDSVS